tara:strand:- start:2848 stop:4386 length:1539 start_codon:yes stop_codon:yes gene_type:complete
VRKLNLHPIIFCIIPVITLIPVTIQILSDIHTGGLNILYSFFQASINPSLEKSIIKNAFNGIFITSAVGFISWILSCLFGIILGVLSSKFISKKILNKEFYAYIVKTLLSIPRSMHELIWGLLLIQFFGLNPWIAILAILIPYSSLVAKVISDQLDILDDKYFFACKTTGANNLISLLTTLTPKVYTTVRIYCGYRLECALRGATILGIFGLGGIGNNLILTLKSLQFQEMWTNLWILWFTLIIFEKVFSKTNNNLNRISIYSIPIITLIIASIIWLNYLGFELLTSVSVKGINLPSLIDIQKAFYELNIYKLIYETLLITFLASGIAIGLPILVSLVWPNFITTEIASICLSLLRLFPAPLTALLIILCTNPSISVASLALGLQNVGVMGRLLSENIKNQNKTYYKAMTSFVAGNKVSNLYGILTMQAKSYLSYAAYRSEMILRETALVGVVGGIGLGWQLQESLSSFDWPQVTLVIICYIVLIIIGENISGKFSNHWIMKRSESINLHHK